MSIPYLIHTPVTDALSIQQVVYGYLVIIEVTDREQNLLTSKRLKEIAAPITITMELYPSKNDKNVKTKPNLEFRKGEK